MTGSRNSAAANAVAARLIEIAEGRLVANKVFNFSGPLTSLQQIEGQMLPHNHMQEVR